MRFLPVAAVVACALASKLAAPVRAASTNEAAAIDLSISQIKALSPAVVEAGQAVRTTGRVVFCNRSGDCFLHDGVAGIYFLRLPGPDELPAGCLVAVEGFVRKGLYAPILEERSAKILDTGALHPPKTVSYEELISGAADCEWAEIRGIVHEAHWKGGIMDIKLSMGGGSLIASIYDCYGLEPEQLVDARVRVFGAVGGDFTRRRQLAEPRLFVSGPGALVIDQPPPADPFNVPLRSADSLLQFRSEKGDGHRIKVRGRVIFRVSGNAIFLRDASAALRIQTSEGAALAVGEEVEALGYAEMGVYTPILKDAVFRRAGPAASPPPLQISARDFLRGEHDADLISTEGILLESFQNSEDEVFVVQGGGVVFNARRSSQEGSKSRKILNGSRLKLTGVGLVDSVSEVSSGTLIPGSFQLLLRSPDGLEALSEPSWWTPARLSKALGMAAIVILLVLVWVYVLRGRLRRQRALIEEKLQREAALEERQRIAREFHDSLQQDLVGLTLQLETAALQLPQSSAQAAESLDLARQMSRRSLEEAHRTLRGLRSLSLEACDLPGALEAAAAELTRNGEAEVQITITGNARQLPGWTEHHLLRIGQECIANALEHGRARVIDIRLDYTADALRFSIIDDGAGFETAAECAPQAGHFGLLGAKERVEKLGGVLRLSSSPGQGAQIEISLPYRLPQ